MVRICCCEISDLDLAGYQRLWNAATPLRRSRAAGYKFPADRNRCIVSDALLRHALGRADFSEERDEFGKPFIRQYPDFQYSLSHSGDWVVLAWAPTPVGADVQQILWDSGKERLARRWFTEEEQAYLFQEGTDRPRRFAEIWTGKESYLKFRGTGIRGDLDTFSVLSREHPRRITHMPDERHFLTVCTTESDHGICLLTLDQL